MGRTVLHEASVQGNTEMAAYMMEHVNPNVDARDVVGLHITGARLRMIIEWELVRTAAMQLWSSFRWYTEYGLEYVKGFWLKS